MSGSLIPNGKQQYLDANGAPLAGGKVYYYIPYTTTAKNTWQDINLTILNTNPIILDSAGECIAWGSGAYRQQIYDVNDNLIWDQYTYGISPAGSNFISQEEVQTATQGQVVFTLSTITYVPGINSLVVFVNGSKQVTGTNYTETAGNTVTFVTGLNAGDVVDFYASLPATAQNMSNAVNVAYVPPFPASATTNVQDKLAQTISVIDFGADPTGVADSSTAFGNALTASQTSGIGVLVPDGTYKILSRANFPRQGGSVTPVNIISGSNVIYTGTIVAGVFTSSPAFGASVVNGYNLSNYNYMYSAPNQAIQDPGALGTYPFGSATLSVDSKPGTTYRGNADAAFFQISGQSGANYAQGGINVVSNMELGFLGNANCIELDLGNFAANGKGLGITVIGSGTFEPEVGVKVARVAYGSQSTTGAGGNWIPAYQNGIQIYNSKQGIYIDQSQVQTPGSAIGITPGPQATSTNLAIYVQDPATSYTFGVQNNGYIAYRDASPITSLGTNVVAATAPQAPSSFLMSNKTVRLAGKITSSSTVASGSTLFTLATQYRPNRTVIVPAVADNGTVTWIQISTAGIVTCGISVTTAFYLTLDSVSYLLNN